MSIERVSQTRDMGIYEITVAINDPLKQGSIDELDKVLSALLNWIESGIVMFDFKLKVIEQ